VGVFIGSGVLVDVLVTVGSGLGVAVGGGDVTVGCNVGVTVDGGWVGVSDGRIMAISVATGVAVGSGVDVSFMLKATMTDVGVWVAAAGAATPISTSSNASGT